VNPALKRILVCSLSIILLAVLAVSSWLVWGSWVSPFERRAMTDALSRIDEVAEYGGSDTAGYEQTVQAARTAILICERRAVTAYDKQLEPLLVLQLEGAQAEYATRIKTTTDPNFEQKLAVISDLNRRTEAVLRSHLQ
jgi:hypothetical protein